MTRLGLRIPTVLLALLFMGDPVHAELCQPASAPCAGAPSKPMSCCQAGHCGCDLSLPSQPMPRSLPGRTASVTRHEITKCASLPVSTALSISREHFSRRPTGDVCPSQFLAVAPYAFTHAFLI